MYSSSSTTTMEEKDKASSSSSSSSSSVHKVLSSTTGAASFSLHVKKKLSFGIKKREPSSSIVSSASSTTTCSSSAALSWFPNEEKRNENGSTHTNRTETLLSISSAGEMETTGGAPKYQGPIIHCKRRIQPGKLLLEHKRVDTTRNQITNGQYYYSSHHPILTNHTDIPNPPATAGATAASVPTTALPTTSTTTSVVAITPPATAGISSHDSGKPFAKESGLILQRRKELDTNSRIDHVQGTMGNAKEQDKRFFREELKNYPDFSPLCYHRISVEEFGMAVLRGMGYVPEDEQDITNTTTTQEQTHLTTTHHQTRGELNKRKWVKPYELKQRIYQKAGLGADEKELVPLPTDKIINQDIKYQKS